MVEGNKKISYDLDKLKKAEKEVKGKSKVIKCASLKTKVDKDSVSIWDRI